MILSEKETEFLQLLAKWFEEGKVYVPCDVAMKEVGVDEKRYDNLVRTMEELGAIEKVSSADQCYAVLVYPSAKAVQLVREIDLEKQKMATPPDIVEQLKVRVRQNPCTAWPVIIFIALALFIPMLNNLFELINKIIDLFR